VFGGGLCKVVQLALPTEFISLLDSEGEPLLTAGVYRCYWLFRGVLWSV